MNKTWLKRTLLGVAVSSALLGTVAAYSEDAGFHPAPPSAEEMAKHEAKLLERIGKKLVLDAGQAAKLKTFVDLVHADRAHPSTGTDPHEAVKSLVAGPKFDRAGAKALVDKHVAKLQADTPKLIDAFGNFYDSLNPTQQQLLRNLAEHHEGLFPFGPGGFGGPHGGFHGPRGGEHDGPRGFHDGEHDGPRDGHFDHDHHGPQGASAPAGN